VSLAQLPPLDDPVQGEQLDGWQSALGVVGMIGYALGAAGYARIYRRRRARFALAVALAFVFGYGLTMQPVLRAGVPFRRALSIVFASDTVSIGTMELVDNAFILLVPGALAAGLLDGLFWWSLAVSLAIAFVLTVPVNRALIARGRGHAVVHELHVH
jgi:hypothetical protein